MQEFWLTNAEKSMIMALGLLTSGTLSGCVCNQLSPAVEKRDITPPAPHP
jgi:hypothetical protein